MPGRGDSLPALYSEFSGVFVLLYFVTLPQDTLPNTGIGNDLNCLIWRREVARRRSLLGAGRDDVFRPRLGLLAEKRSHD